MFLLPLGILVLAADATFEYCGVSNGPKAGDDYKLEPNQWNNKDRGLKSCLTYRFDEKTDKVDWAVQWRSPGKTVAPKAYPHMRVRNGTPVRMKDVAFLQASLNWTYQVLKNPTDEDMASAAVRANVAFDMFFDADSKIAQDTSAASHEVMVWLAQFGRVVPIGYDDVAPYAEIKLFDIDFWIYKANNTLNQLVITFVAKQGRRINSVDWDMMVFLRQVSIILPEFAPELWIGHLQIGSELFEATTDVKLSITDSRILIGASEDADKPNKDESDALPPTRVQSSVPLPPKKDLNSFVPPDMAGVPRSETESGLNFTTVSDLGYITVDQASLAPPPFNASKLTINGHGGSKSTKSGAAAAVLNVGILSLMAAFVLASIL